MLRRFAMGIESNAPILSVEVQAVRALFMFGLANHLVPRRRFKQRSDACRTEKKTDLVPALTLRQLRPVSGRIVRLYFMAGFYIEAAYLCCR